MLLVTLHYYDVDLQTTRIDLLMDCFGVLISPVSREVWVSCELALMLCVCVSSCVVESGCRGNGTNVSIALIYEGVKRVTWEPPPMNRYLCEK